MNDSLSSLQDNALDELVADAMHTQTIATKPNRVILERLKTFDEYYGALNEPPAGPALLYRDASNSEIKAVPMADSVTIGRDAKCEAAFPGDTHLSRQHCKITLEGGFFILNDLHSHNGTYVNALAEPVKEHVLRDGDIISAGRQTMVFSCGQSDWGEEF